MNKINAPDFLLVPVVHWTPDRTRTESLSVTGTSNLTPTVLHYYVALPVYLTSVGQYFTTM